MNQSNVAKKLTIEDKIEIIETFENRNMDIEELLKKFDITDTQLHGILKNKEIIEEIFKHEVNDESKKKERVTVYEEINETLYSWFLSAKERNMPLSGPILQEKAKEIARELGTVEFKASNGWLQGFKKRKGISFSRRITPVPMYTNSTPKVEFLDSSYQDDDDDNVDNHSGFYTDQVENLKMYNLRPVNPNMHAKKTVKNEPEIDHSDSSNSSSTGVPQRNTTTKNVSLVSIKKTTDTSSASASPRNQTYSPEPSSGTDCMSFKHSSNPDMPRIKYYGSLRNNSNFSKMSCVTAASTLNNTITSGNNNLSANNNNVILNNSNGPMTRLRRSANEALNSSTNVPQKRPSLVMESKKVSIGNSALTQRNVTNNSKTNNNGVSRSSTLIDLSSDEENERKYKDKSVSLTNKKQKMNGPDLSSQYGIPILDFSHEDTIRKCSQNGITAFIPLKALNSNEPSELCLPLIQVKDFEKKRFLFSTNRFLRIGTIKSVSK